MMDRKLIINADGYGFTAGINRGIRESIANGIVRSTSCVVNFPFIAEIPALADNFKDISIGVHFNLSVGKPVSTPDRVRSLLNEKGEFWGDLLPEKLLFGKVKLKEMFKELESQVKVLLDLGVQPSHWDGHQNKHLYPPFFFAAKEVAHKYNILRIRTHNRYIFLQKPEKRNSYLIKYYLKNPRRIMTHSFARCLTMLARMQNFRMADRLISPAYADESKKFLLETWLAIMKYLPQGVSEIYCHPGYVDEVLKKYASYVYEREQEIQILTSAAVKDALVANKIQTISFKEI